MQRFQKHAWGILIIGFDASLYIRMCTVHIPSTISTTIAHIAPSTEIHYCTIACMHAPSARNIAIKMFPLIIIANYCILRGRIKGFNRSITTILFEVGSYITVVG